MFGPGGGRVYEVCGDEDLLCEGPDWMAACGGLGNEVRNHYLDAVTLLAAKRSPQGREHRKQLDRLKTDEIDLRVTAISAAVGEFPVWWPVCLPHVLIELREARAPEAEPERVFVDPNRPGLGADLAWSRAKLWLMARPVPYAGRITLQVKGPDGGSGLAQLEMWFEVDTAGQPGDPGVRDALAASERQARRAHREYLEKIAQAKHKDREMRLMHGQIAGAVRSGADAVRAAQGLPSVPDKPGGPEVVQQIGLVALPILRDLAMQYLPTQLPRVLRAARQEVGPEVVERFAREIASQVEPQVLVVLVQQARGVLGDDGLNEVLRELGLNIDLASEQDGSTQEPRDEGEEDSIPEVDELQPQAESEAGSSSRDEVEHPYDHDQGDATSEWADAIFRSLNAVREE